MTKTQEKLQCSPATDYQPPLDPNKPAVLSFYTPFYFPGLDIAAQGAKGRTELLGMNFADIERKIRLQLADAFSSHGFNPKDDIAGLIVNRWGHAYVAPQPGFYFGTDGASAPRDIVRKGHGRIAFGHSELQGNQHWGPAADEGARAARQALNF